MIRGRRVRRAAIFVHRWMGVALAGFFLLWFPSAIGMMYGGFPGVSAADRLDRAAALDRSTIRISPAQAYAVLRTAEPASHIVLNVFDGHPVYRIRCDGAETLIYADTGKRRLAVSTAALDRVASTWAGAPLAAARAETMTDVDQWTVDEALRRGPLRKYSWPDGQQVYVSEASGEVVQYTTTSSRIAAYVGPIPHWLYFTPLRRRALAWRALVIGASATATLTALFGLSIGIWSYSPAKRYRRAGRPAANPYRGVKRWHLAVGLIVGLGAATWAFSGMLSMDPFGSREPTAIDSDGEASATGISGALRGPIQLQAYARRTPQDALAQLSPLDVKQLELATVAGSPVYIATLAGGDTRIVPLSGAPSRDIDRHRLFEAVSNAARPRRLLEIRSMDRYDRYYLDRYRRRALPVVLARLDDADQSRYYIDPRTGAVVGAYRARDWTSRWLYHGLHSLDFPWLYDHRPAWDIVVLTFMLGGSALSFTGAVLGWRALGRALR